MATSPSEKEGYMKKLGENNKSWKKRWFVLRDRLLYYYRDQADINGKYRGVIDLEGCIISKIETPGEKRLLFAIAPPPLSNRQRTFYLCCDNQDDLENWVDIIREKTELYEERSSSVGRGRSLSPLIRSDSRRRESSLSRTPSEGGEISKPVEIQQTGAGRWRSGSESQDSDNANGHEPSVTVMPSTSNSNLNAPVLNGTVTTNTNGTLGASGTTSALNAANDANASAGDIFVHDDDDASLNGAQDESFNGGVGEETLPGVGTPTLGALRHRHSVQLQDRIEGLEGKLRVKTAGLSAVRERLEQQLYRLQEGTQAVDPVLMQAERDRIRQEVEEELQNKYDLILEERLKEAEQQRLAALAECEKKWQEKIIEYNRIWEKSFTDNALEMEMKLSRERQAKEEANRKLTVLAREYKKVKEQQKPQEEEGGLSKFLKNIMCIQGDDEKLEGREETPALLPGPEASTDYPVSP
eukprot:TRINITY_DN12469_c0_g1::TRINITY_DN12469_c0_g1_i1::g.15148::m.15148 TRINITY_DN12469_c0_g1::TRINITY_DN12469_c0_g1_i1::g.15148  ORF type:complete len:484 (-),score=93.58,sp/Q8N4B1/SESQ1_HUMAN/35.35/4e-12,PH/PF00169.24/1.2e-16,PH_11/PF15413.1/7.8e-08,PH_8/PF15409.1/0.0023,UPF0449/PF15136.1/0.22,UPF0449/PF15136.1/1e+04,YqjK/PF13997.1/5.7e+02,YqjK/PF13997.1/0.76,Birna_RdRp/PF04197.7/1.6 TRINITY_DN12469_c0_g1_i1:683-2089(-)